MFDNLRRDRERYAARGRWWLHAGFWIVANYRFGQWAHGLGPALRLPFWVLYRLFRLPLALWSVHLWAGASGAKVGPGLVLIHPRNVMIGAGVEVGRDVIIFHDVTIGTGPTPGKPRIGDYVDIYVGARILGGVTIGEKAMIGANCVVTRSVPANSIAMVAPARVIPRSLSPVARSADGGTPPAPGGRA
jgi:serine O-acetyltransferase